MRNDIQQARIDLAAAFRLAVRHGLHEGICNHFSLMLPGSDELFLVNPYGLHWSEIKASDLMLLDQAGRPVEGKGEVNPAPSTSMPAFTAPIRMPGAYCTRICLMRLRSR